MKLRRIFILLLIMFLSFTFILCGNNNEDNGNNNRQTTENEQETQKDNEDIINMNNSKEIYTTIKMATTTSTENSGLLDYMLPKFTEKKGIAVDVIAVGTGAALNLGRNGDVDVVMVHAREAELEFVEEGHGVNREDIMYNDFVILGPVEDPAGVKGSMKVEEALQKIAENEATFVSRGDDSGTHKKEMQLWEESDINPSGDWYLEAGRGMGDVITMADQQQAYTLADRGTYLSMRDKIELKILFWGDEMLFNPYGIIAINPEKHPEAEIEPAMALVEWFISDEAKKLIKTYRVQGEQLFYTYD
jgi:tungstate transport system substrate-binding protein